MITYHKPQSLNLSTWIDLQQLVIRSSHNRCLCSIMFYRCSLDPATEVGIKDNGVFWMDWDEYLGSKSIHEPWRFHMSTLRVGRGEDRFLNVETKSNISMLFESAPIFPCFRLQAPKL